MRRWMIVVLTGLASAGGAGCGALGLPSIPSSTPETIEDGNADADGLRTIGSPRGEPNDDFSLAIPAIFNHRRSASLLGVIQFLGDLDVYDVGPLRAGDRLIVDVDASGGVLDASVAVFDARRRLFIENDDRGGEVRALDSRIDEIVRHDSERYYLAIGAAAFAGGGAQRLGPYRIAVTVIPDQEVPPPVRQTIVLDFDGGPVSAPTIPVSFVEPFEDGRCALRCGKGWRAEVREVTPFDAGAISPLLAQETSRIKAIIVETVRSNFEPFGVDVLTSDDPEPEPGTFSSILFGGANPIAFGIAEAIDHFNADPADMVVIFTGSFQPEVFSRTPTTAELGVAIGNVAAHEAGHILGLNHVNNVADLMDAISPPDTLIEDQEFDVSPLSEQIMPLGVQDGPLLLLETTGPR